MRNFLKIRLVDDLVDFLELPMLINASLPSCPWIGNLNMTKNRMKKKSHVVRRHSCCFFFLKTVTDDLN